MKLTITLAILMFISQVFGQDTEPQQAVKVKMTLKTLKEDGKHINVVLADSKFEGDTSELARNEGCVSELQVTLQRNTVDIVASEASAESMYDGSFMSAVMGKIAEYEVRNDKVEIVASKNRQGINIVKSTYGNFMLGSERLKSRMTMGISNTEEYGLFVTTIKQIVNTAYSRPTDIKASVTCMYVEKYKN